MIPATEEQPKRHSGFGAGDFEPSPARRLVCLILCALVMFLDGFDIVAMGLAVPHLAKAYAISPASFGVALSAALVGVGAGGLLLGRFGDRYGRRPLIIASTAIIAVATLATATGKGIHEFELWRLLTGLALGTCLPNVSALIAELAPAARRAFILTLVSLGVSLGAMTSGLLVPWLVSLGGWRAIFIAPGLFAAVLAALLTMFLVESPTLRRSAMTGNQGSPSRMRELIRPPLLVATMIFSLLYSTSAFDLFLLTSWVPTLFPRAGFSVETGAHSLALLQFGGIVAGVLVSQLLDRGHAVRALASVYFSSACALALFSLIPPDATSWGLLIMVAGGGFAGSQFAMMAVATEFFPPRLLASALGFGVAVARLSAIAAPLLGAWLIKVHLSAPAFFMVAAIPGLLCAVGCFAIPIGQRIGRAHRV